MINKEVICKWIGHKIAENTDGGFCFCERCGLHEYWHSASNRVDFNFEGMAFEDAGILLRPYWYIKHRIVRYYLLLKNRIKFYHSILYCHNCNQNSLLRNWDGCICPKCGEEDLPF